MSDIPVKLTCPLGSECEIVKDGAIHRCRWYVELAGRHPSTGEPLNRKDCAITWMPVLLVENAMTNRGQTQALESFRNEVVNQSKTANKLRALALNSNLLPHNKNGS